MPREMTLTSSVPVSLPDLVRAGSAVDGSLVPRTLFGGWALQLVDTEDVAVLTVELSRRIEEPWDVERLTGRPVSEAQRSGAAELWWTEATAPWGEAGEAGVRILRRLAALMPAELTVDEGR